MFANNQASEREQAREGNAARMATHDEVPRVVQDAELDSLAC